MGQTNQQASAELEKLRILALNATVPHFAKWGRDWTRCAINWKPKVEEEDLLRDEA